MEASNSQSYLFETIDIADGLAQNSVMTIAKDKYEFIWFGTEDGLSRYDGVSFKTFRHDPLNPSSINSNSILSSLVDREGNLWVGTYVSGLNKYIYETESFIQYPHDPLDSLSIGDGSIYAIHEDHFGHIWIGTSGAGLFRLDPNSGISTPLSTLLPEGSALSDTVIISLFEDHNHQLWISTIQGLNVLDLNAYTLKTYQYDPEDPTSPFDDYINAVYETFDGKDYHLWIGTNWGGLDRFDPVEEHFIHHGYKSVINPDYPETSVMWMLQESEDCFWLGTDSKGILIMNSEGKLVDQIERRVYDQTALQDDIINTFYDDGDIIWIGTSASGVSKYARHRKPFYSINYNPLDPTGLHDDRILRTIMDSKDNVWIATWTEGLTRYNPRDKSFKVFKHDPNDPGSLSDNGIQDIMVDRHDNIWVISASSTLDVLRAGTEIFEHIPADYDDPTALRSDYLTTAYEDPDGFLWFGSWDQGLAKSDPETGLFQTFVEPHIGEVSLGNISFYSMFMDSHGTLWIGAENEGLIGFDQSDFTLVQFKAIPGDPFALPNNDVMCFHEDSDGFIWLGTYGGGLTRFDPINETFQSFGINEGILSQTIYKIFEDKNNNLWMSTNNGLSQFDKQLQVFKNYGIPDGVLSKEFNPAGCITKDGWMYFGGVKGITYFNPAAIQDNAHIPQIQFTGLSIMNEPIQVNETYNDRIVLNKTITDSPIIHLYPEDLFYSIQFASLDYYYSKNNQYAYQLEGFDDEWRYIGHQKEVTFTNLPSGKYVLRVKGSNNDGIWNEDGTTIALVIHPEFYDTWWFISAIVFLSGIGIFVLFRMRTNFLVQRSEELSLHNIELNAQIESRRKAHQRARERADYFRAVISQSPLPMAIHNMEGCITHLNQGWIDLWESSDAETIIRDYQVHTDPLAQQLELAESFQKALNGEIVDQPEISLLGKNNQVKIVHVLAYPLKDKVKATNQVMISLEDITEIVQHRNLLEKSLTEKELLLKEVHHRVKNNLQIIASLLGLQKAGLNDDAAAQMLEEFRNRVNSMALVHDALYRSPEFDNIDIAAYIRGLSADLQSAFAQGKSAVSIVAEIPEINLSVDVAVPCGLLINELVTNALKYAFPNSETSEKEILIRFTKLDNNYLKIEVKDNGVGFQKPVVWDSVESLGLYLVKILGEQQLMGTVKLENEGGAHFTIEFPLSPDFDH